MEQAAHAADDAIDLATETLRGIHHHAMLPARTRRTRADDWAHRSGSTTEKVGMKHKSTSQLAMHRQSFARRQAKRQAEREAVRAALADLPAPIIVGHGDYQYVTLGLDGIVVRCFETRAEAERAMRLGVMTERAEEQARAGGQGTRH